MTHSESTESWVMKKVLVHWSAHLYLQLLLQELWNSLLEIRPIARCLHSTIWRISLTIISQVLEYLAVRCDVCLPFQKIWNCCLFILIVLKLIVKVVGPDSVEHEHFFFKLERVYFK